MFDTIESALKYAEDSLPYGFYYGAIYEKNGRYNASRPSDYEYAEKCGWKLVGKIEFHAELKK